MGLKDAISAMEQAIREVADDKDLGDLREFLKQHGLVQSAEAGTLMHMMGTVVARLVELGVDPSALGTAAAVLGGLAQPYIDKANAEAKEGDG